MSAALRGSSATRTIGVAKRRTPARFTTSRSPSGPQISVAFRSTTPSRPRIAKTLPAGTRCTLTRSRPIIMYSACTRHVRTYGSFAASDRARLVSYLGRMAVMASPTLRRPLYSRAKPSITSGASSTGAASAGASAAASAPVDVIASRWSRPRSRISSAVSWTRRFSGMSSRGTANILLT